MVRPCHFNSSTRISALHEEVYRAHASSSHNARRVLRILSFLTFVSEFVPAIITGETCTIHNTSSLEQGLIAAFVHSLLAVTESNYRIYFPDILTVHVPYRDFFDLFSPQSDAKLNISTCI